MKTALLRKGDKEEITADDAASSNETRAFCPECERPVRLHRKGKSGVPAAHFEHLNRSGRCSRQYGSNYR